MQAIITKMKLDPDDILVVGFDGPISNDDLDEFTDRLRAGLRDAGTLNSVLVLPMGVKVLAPRGRSDKGEPEMNENPRVLRVTCPVNVVALDAPDPNAGNASHVYEIQFGGPAESLTIMFQHGPRGGADSTPGVFEDALLAILQDRMEGFQSGPFACPENQMCLEAIREARDALDRRVANRMAQKVLGVNKPHVSQEGA